MSGLAQAVGRGRNAHVDAQGVARQHKDINTEVKLVAVDEEWLA